MLLWFFSYVFYSVLFFVRCRKSIKWLIFVLISLEWHTKGIKKRDCNEKWSSINALKKKKIIIIRRRHIFVMDIANDFAFQGDTCKYKWLNFGFRLLEVWWMCLNFWWVQIVWEKKNVLIVFFMVSSSIVLRLRQLMNSS